MTKINVEILGFPMVSDVLGRKRLEVDVFDTTIKAVLDELITRYGKRVRDAFYDSEGNFDLSIQTTLNGSFIGPDEHRNPLIKEGDTVTFMLVLAGG